MCMCVYASHVPVYAWNFIKNDLTSWGSAVPSSVKLEVKAEVVVKVSSLSRGHSVLLRVGGWLGKLRI